MRRVTMAILGGLLAAAGPAAAEVAQVKIGRAPGLNFLPLYVMEHEKLVEKQARAAGLEALSASYGEFTGGNVMNDAMLSDNLHVAAGGVPPFLTLWSRVTGTRQEIKAIAALRT